MNTITIPKTEYRKLKQRSSAYLKIVKNIRDTERGFAYDYKYIKELTTESRSAHKGKKTVEAASVDEALKKITVV